MNAALRKVVLLVAILNLAYFGVEFGVALAIGSVSLFADSVDFLEDASINLLIAIALGVECKQSGASRKGARRRPANPESRYTLGRMAEVHGSGAAIAHPSIAYRSGSVGNQSLMCLHAGALPVT